MGRTALMMVIVFNLIFMAMGFRVSAITTSAYSKYIAYDCIEQASLVAESAANIGISNVFFSPATAIPGTAFSGGTGMGGTFQITKTQSMQGGINGFDLNIIARDSSVTVFTYVRVQGNSFSQFVMFTTTEGGIYWTTGDTCRGNYHTQDNINCSGSPDFQGLVTCFGRSIGGTPNFERGYVPGVDIPLTGDFTDLTTLATAGGTTANYSVATYIEFLQDGRVIVRTGSGGWTESRTTMNGSVPYCKTYSSISALTSSGVLNVTGGDLHLKGVLSGQITVGNTGSGDIYIDSSVVYKNPAPTSKAPLLITTDMLGIVAKNDIWVTDNTNNNNPAKGVEIDASMYSSTGGFGAQNYANRGGSHLYTGYIKVVGGIQESARNPVGQLGGSPVYGSLKDYAYNLNLQYISPKGYPITKFGVKNWIDSTVISSNFWTDIKQ
jgi:hypothetical protein